VRVRYDRVVSRGGNCANPVRSALPNAHNRHILIRKTTVNGARDLLFKTKPYLLGVNSGSKTSISTGR
jgi:hypothetical protein